MDRRLDVVQSTLNRAVDQRGHIWLGDDIVKGAAVAVLTLVKVSRHSQRHQNGGVLTSLVEHIFLTQYALRLGLSLSPCKESAFS
jgi:hypothetical protein